MATIAGDIRYALRSLIRSPGFTVVAVASLALGIGANTSIFAVVHATLFRQAPYEAPEELAIVRATEVGHWSYPLFEAFQAQSPPFAGVAAFTHWNPSLNLGGIEVPERVPVEFVSAGYTSVLGVRPELGRGFLAEEDATPGSHPVALIAHGLWRRVFGSDPDVVGRQVVLNGVPITVVGVMPEGFAGLSENAEVWLPMMMAPTFTTSSRLEQRLSFWHQVVVRLRPDQDRAAAVAELERVASSMEERFSLPSEMSMTLEPVPLQEWRVDPGIRSPLFILLAAVAFVLLIACVNIANLALSRASMREREIAVRAALGASRGRLLRFLLAESLVLGLIGGAVGLVAAVWGIDLLGALKPASLTAVDLEHARLTGPVIGFNLAASLIAALLFGLVPAVQHSRPDLREALAQASGRTIGGLFRLRRPGARSLLIVAEIALALVLLVGAGLMIRSLVELRTETLGFEPQNRLTAAVSLPRQEYEPERGAAFFSALAERSAALPGARTTTVANCLPLMGRCDYVMMRIEDRAGAEGAEQPTALNMVGAAYFDVMDVPLLRGRAFSGQDDRSSRKVAIISRTAAERFWPDADPIGRRVRPSIGWPEGEWAEIVGVVGDVQYDSGIDAEMAPVLYVPYRQFAYLRNYIVVEAQSGASGLAAPLRAQVRQLDANLPLHDVKTMSDRIGDATSRTRFMASLLATFAGLALLLAIVGVYGVVAYAVSTRRRELGLRMALGAEAGQVLKLVLRDSLTLTLVGIGVGIAAAVVLSRFLGGQLYGVEPADPPTFLVVTLLLVGAALAASWIPARRATRVDPLIALRQE